MFFLDMFRKLEVLDFEVWCVLEREFAYMHFTGVTVLSCHATLSVRWQTLLLIF